MRQRDVAKRMKISTQRYSVLENNDNRPEERTCEILKALNITESMARDFLNTIPREKIG